MHVVQKKFFEKRLIYIKIASKLEEYEQNARTKLVLGNLE